MLRMRMQDVVALADALQNPEAFGCLIAPQQRLIRALITPFFFFLQNAEFAKAFGCPVGAPMNPIKKCVLWKDAAPSEALAAMQVQL